jgi:hypothetical protein
VSWLQLRSSQILLQHYFLRPSPPIRGRNGEFDGGSFCIAGVGKESSASSSAKQQWSWEAIFLSITSAADGSRPTSKANPWPIQKPAKGSGESTSFVRPLLRSAVAYYVCTEASGFIPASTHDGGVADLRLGGGEREGSDCVFPFFSEVFSVNAEDLYVFSDLMGSFVIICTSTVWNY